MDFILGFFDGFGKGLPSLCFFITCLLCKKVSTEQKVNCQKTKIRLFKIMTKINDQKEFLCNLVSTC